MRIGDLTPEMMSCHLREIPENLTPSEISYINILKEAAINYCINYTGLSKKDLNAHEDITIAVLCLVADMYENRTMTINEAKPNRTVETILNFHCTTYVPKKEL